MVTQSSRAAIRRYLEANAPDFNERRLSRLRSLKPSELFGKNINPYFLSIGPLMTPRQRVEAALGAILSAHDKAVLGELLTNLAIFLCQQAYGGGGKATAEGIDLEFEKDGVRYLVAIKPGPNWGNSSQIKRMRDNFRQGAKIVRAGCKGKKVESVNGCCYGKQAASSEDKGDYRKLCGQSFWDFITGDAEIYKRIVNPIGEKARDRNDQFRIELENVTDKFVLEFRTLFCFCDRPNAIDWDKVVEFASGRKAAPKTQRA